MPSTQATTPEQRAAALAITGARNRQYKSLLRAFQRGSAAGAAGKQRRSGQKLAEKLEYVSRETEREEFRQAAEFLRFQKTERERQKIGIVTGPRPRNLTFIVHRLDEFPTVIRGEWEMRAFQSRDVAISYAKMYVSGNGEEDWANALVKKFAVRYRESGRRYKRLTHNKSGNATVKLLVADVDEWVIYAIDKIDPHLFYLSLELAAFYKRDDEDDDEDDDE